MKSSFYDVNGGVVSFEKRNVKEWNVKFLRSQMALVGQEPILFNVSIKENIVYGAEDGQASSEQIETAARMANIHGFIMSLPEGYETLVGEKGGALSGGTA
jgi:ATP-binding cassette subfamily B (MDR/TAP) protein 1